MAKYYDIAQGDDNWFSMRLGIPTASEFGKIITPKTMQLSKQAGEYASLKIAEIMMGESQGIIEPTYYMERGALLELEAREAYEFKYDVEVKRGGFITTDDGFVGCSPDGLIDEDGCCEIKCLMAKNHVEFLFNDDIDPKHKPQVQGQLWVSEREWCDYWLYHPDMMPHRIRIERDDAYIKLLEACMAEFRDMMSERIVNFQRRGLWQTPPKPNAKPSDAPNNIMDAG